MSISSASVYGAPQPTSWRDISAQISSLADIFRKERQRNEELFLNEAYRQITTAYNGDAFAWAQNEPESYKKFAKLLGLPETPGKVTPQGWLALGKIATAEALRQGKEPFEYSVQKEPVPIPQTLSVPQSQPITPAVPPPPQGPETIPVSTSAGAQSPGQATSAPVPSSQPGPSKTPYDKAVEEALRQANQIAEQSPTEAKMYVSPEEVLAEGFLYLQPDVKRIEATPKPPAEPIKISQEAGVAANILLDKLQRENRDKKNKKYTLSEVNQIVSKNADALYNMIPNPQVSKDQFIQQLGLELSRKLDTSFLLDKSEKSVVSGTPPKNQTTTQPQKGSDWGPAAPAPNPTKSPQTPQPSTPTYTSNPKEQETKKLSNQISTVTTKVAEEGKVDPKELPKISKMIDNTIQPPPPEVQKQVKRVVVTKLKPEFQGNMYLRLIESQYQDPDSPIRKTFEGLYAGEVKSMEELKRLQLENRQLETTVKALYDDPEMVELLKQKIRAEVKELMASGDLKLAQARNLENVLTNEILKTAVSLYASGVLSTMAQQQGNTELLKITNELANSLKTVKDLGDKELTAQFATALSKLLARATGEQTFLQFSTKSGWLFGLWTTIISKLAQFPPQPPAPDKPSPYDFYREGLERSGVISPYVLKGLGSQGGQNDAQRRILEQIMNTLQQLK